MSPEDCVEILESQDGRCALSGVKLTQIRNKGRVLTNASIDRKEAGGPYIKDNIQIVCLAVNCFRSDKTIEEYIWWCKKVVDHNA